MTRSLIFESVELDELTEAIAKAVVAKLTPILKASREPLLVDGNEMARLAGVSRATIDRLRAFEAIESVMVGSSRRYRPDAVIAALAKMQANDG